MLPLFRAVVNLRICGFFNTAALSHGPWNPKAPPVQPRGFTKRNTNAVIDSTFYSPEQIYEQGVLEPLECSVGALPQQKVENDYPNSM